MKHLSLLIYIFIVHCSLSTVYAQWPTTVEGAITVDNGIYPYLTVDPIDQSVMVVYVRADYNQIRAKKYDKYGYPMWGGNYAVVVDTIKIDQISLWGFEQWGQVISDDSGGVIVCWMDFRHSTFDQTFFPENNEIYIQRVDVNGQARYGEDGTRISTHASQGWHNIGDMKTDYHDGFVIAFSNDTTDTQSVVKRFGRNGNSIWSYYFGQGGIDLNATDAAGSSFISTSDIGNVRKRFKLDLAGSSLWPDTLTGIIPDDRSHWGGGAFSDEHGGVVGVAYRYDEPNYITYVNRVDSTGAYVFGSGVDIINTTGVNYAPDGFGGIFVSFSSNGNKTQRIDLFGRKVFDSIGVSMGGDIVSDQRNGIVVFWVYRTGGTTTFLVQRLDSLGQPLWDSNAVFYNSTNDFFTSVIDPMKSDGRGGAIYIWPELAAGLQLKMKQISRNGILGEVVTSVKEKNWSSDTKVFRLYANHPNPFNSSTRIRYELFEEQQVELKIYNVLGQEVMTMVDSYQQAGYYTVQWDGKNRAGHLVSSGIYIYRIVATSGDRKFIKSKKMMLIK